MQKINLTEIIEKAKKRKIAIVIIMVVVIIIFILSRTCKKGSRVEFKYDKISIGEVKKTISVTGTLHLLVQHAVLAKVGGMVEKVTVGVNAKVKKNQLIAQIDSTDIDREIIKRRLQVSSYNLTLQKHIMDVKVKERQFKDGFISKTALQQSKATLQSIRNTYATIWMDLNYYLTLKRHTIIRSPIKGIVYEVKVVPNTPIAKNFHSFTITSSFKDMFLVISIDESDIGNIKIGQITKFSVSAFPNKFFIGKVTSVGMNPIKRGGLVIYEATVSCKNDQLLLKPGMTATAVINVGKRKKVLRVLNQSFLVAPKEVKLDPKKKFVWKKIKGTINGIPMKRIELKVGLQGDMYTEVISKNLKKGDNVLKKVMIIKK